MASRARSTVTLAGGRQIEVAIPAERLAQLIAGRSPGRIGLHDVRTHSWEWLELTEIAGVEPRRATDPGPATPEAA